MITYPSWLVFLSRCLNTVTGGSPSQSMCARIHSNNWSFAEYLVNKLFWFDPDHCRKAHLWDRRKNQRNK